MNTEIVGLEPSAATSIYDIAAEVGETRIDEVASSLWYRLPREEPPPAGGDVDPWAHACCCCACDERDGLEDAGNQHDDPSDNAGPLIFVVSPLMTEDVSHPLSAEEVVFGVRANRRRRALRSVEPVWLC